MEKLTTFVEKALDGLTNQTAAKTAEAVRGQKDLVIVSDYAVAQGAQYDSVESRDSAYHLVPRAQIIADIAKNNKPSKELKGVAPVIDPVRFPGFYTKGGYAAYKDQLVYLPQKEVDQKLSDELSALLKLSRAEGLEQGFGDLGSCLINSQTRDNRDLVLSSCYYYQNQAYCNSYRSNDRNSDPKWYHLSPVAARIDEKGYVRCQDVLLADYTYDQDSLAKYLIKSTVVNELPAYHQQQLRKNQAALEDEKSL